MGKNNCRVENRSIPIVIFILFLVLTGLSISLMVSQSSKRLQSEYVGICEALAIALEHHIHRDSISDIQPVIDAFCDTEKRIIRLSFIGLKDDGKFYHLASNWPSRINKPAHKEDLEVIRTNVPVIIKETVKKRHFYDITYPLHDEKGKVVGCIGYTALNTISLNWLTIGSYFGGSILLFILMLINFLGREKNILELLNEQERAAAKLYESEEELRDKVLELNDTLAQMKTLKGVIPICMHCKGIRDDKGAWNQLEEYITEHSDAQFSHGICEKCLKEHYPEYAE